MAHTDDRRAFFATAAKGTEGALRDELRELRLPAVKAERGGVRFGGTLVDAYRACIGSRIAVRVLQEVGRFPCTDGDTLYAGVRESYQWAEVLDVRRTLAVTSAVKNSKLTHSAFVAQRTKDAVVDQLREKLGARPDVDKSDPDVAIFVHLVKDEATVYLDVSGDSLHRRGWRAKGRDAPLKETLAASILRLAGWDRARPLADPMCGSGTLAIEGAQWARRIAPGLARECFGGERWVSHDATAANELDAVREAFRASILPARDAPEILAADLDARAVAQTKENARLAGVPEIHVVQQDISALGPAEPAGHIVVNPPYGIRLAAGDALIEQMAYTFRTLPGHRVSAICADDELARALRPLRPSQEHALWNGDLECRLFSWDIG
jgi:putative N6-adenine-specific DNA methylase